jgi:Leucine-rich repeat (LRR) protein
MSTRASCNRASLKSLTTLRLYDNSLTSLALPAGLTNLTTLALQNNALRSFPFCPNLRPSKHST